MQQNAPGLIWDALVWRTYVAILVRCVLCCHSTDITRKCNLKRLG